MMTARILLLILLGVIVADHYDEVKSLRACFHYDHLWVTMVLNLLGMLCVEHEILVRS